MSDLKKIIGIVGIPLIAIAFAVTMVVGTPSDIDDQPYLPFSVETVDLVACDVSPWSPVIRVVPEGGTVWEEISAQTLIDHPDLSFAEHELRVLGKVQDLREFVNPDEVPAGFAFAMNGPQGFVLTHPVQLEEAPPIGTGSPCDPIETPTAPTGIEDGSYQVTPNTDISPGMPMCADPDDLGVCDPES